MAIKRQLNVLGQQRIDAPHLRMMESAVAADFDALAGEVLAGGQALIVKGFALATTGMSGQPASNLQVVVAGGVLIHPLATESGSVFTVPDSTANEQLSTNAKVEGSFTANATNYVGIDLRREADDTTADTVTFLDAVTWQETPRLVPLARVLNYRFIISTADFSATPHVCPIAIVTTTANNTISTIVDARQMSYRLAAGGASVNNRNAFTWAQGRSVEAGTVDAAFTGGDRAIGSGKEWQDAVMTRLWELGGGERWFTANSDRDTKLCLGGTGLFPNGDNFRWTLGTSLIEWTSLYLVFANSTAVYNTITNGSATLADNQCLYVDVNRSTNATALTMQVANLQQLGAPTIPGSRFIIAWRRGNEVFFRDKQYEAGRTFVAAATNASLGTVQLSYAVTGTPTVAPRADTTGTISNTAAASNGDGLQGTGVGSGRGVLGSGGATGTGVRGVGGATSGAGVIGVATAGNSDGVQGTGIGTGRGVLGTGGATGDGVRGVGGATSGAGVVGVATAGNSDGVQGAGVGTGDGVQGTGGSGTGSAGVRGIAGDDDGAGVIGIGLAPADVTNDLGDGVRGTGGAGDGVVTFGGNGVRGIGGDNAGTGVKGVGGTNGGSGVIGNGTGAGRGVSGTPGATGDAGVYGFGGTAGIGVVGVSNTKPAMAADVSGTSTATNGPAVGLAIRNNTNANDSISSLAFLHSDGTATQDGIAIYTKRIVANRADLYFAEVANNVAGTPFLHYDASTNQWDEIAVISTTVRSLSTRPQDLTLSATGTLDHGDNSYVAILASVGGLSITGLTSPSVDGRILMIRNRSVNSFSITSAAARLSGNAASVTLSTNHMITFVADGGAWFEVSRSD